MNRRIRLCEQIVYQQQQQRRLFATRRKTPLALSRLNTTTFHQKYSLIMNGSRKNRGTPPLFVDFPCDGDFYPTASIDSLSFTRRQTRFFSAAQQPPPLVKKDEESSSVNSSSSSSSSSSSNLIAKRRQLTKDIVQRRKMLKRKGAKGMIKDMMRLDMLEQHEQQRHPGDAEADAATTASAFALPKFQRADFVRLFDSTVPKYSFAKVEDLLKNLDQAVKDTTTTTAAPAEMPVAAATSESDIVLDSKKPKKGGKKSKVGKNTKKNSAKEPASSLPLSTVLRGMLKATNPNNSLQKQVLEYVLFPTTTTTTTTTYTTTANSVEVAGTTDGAAAAAAAAAASYVPFSSPLPQQQQSQSQQSQSQHEQQQHAAKMERVLLSARERFLQNGQCWSAAEARAVSLLTRKEAAARRSDKMQRHSSDLAAAAAVMVSTTTRTPPPLPSTAADNNNNDNDDNHDATTTGSDSSISTISSAGHLVAHLAASLPPRNYRAVCSLFEMYVGGSGSSSSSSGPSVAGGTATTATTHAELDHVGIGPTTEKPPVRLLGDADDDDERAEEFDGEEQENTDLAAANAGEESASPSNKAFTTTAAAGAASVKPKKLKNPFAIRKLSSHIEKLAGGAHYHLVAREVAEFFYVGPELVTSDDHFAVSQRGWDDFKEKFVTFMMNLQTTLHYDDKARFNGTGFDGSGEFVGETETAGDETNVINTSLRPVVHKKEKMDPRRQHRSHLTFEAIPLLQDSGSSASTLNGESDSPLSRMVFVDNLPIDIQDEVVKDVFSRCGDIVSVDIFNRRPDLDPGPLNKSQVIARRKMQIQSVGVYSKRWQRPCTPVYGLLTFADEEGCKKAIDESLRIFGMLVQRHPVRSIPSSDMTRLFIENVPDGHPCLDFEYQLSQVLDPDLFVCLGAGQNNRSIVGSCEIKFQSFDVAYESHKKLQKLAILHDKESKCSLNWVRSPINALLWWSRKLGFD